MDLDQISREVSARKAGDALRYIAKSGVKEISLEYFYALNAEVFFRNFDLKKSLEQIDKAIDIAPGWAPAYNIRANILIELACFREALDNFDLAIALAPQTVEYRFNRGQLLFLLQEWDRGRADYEFRLHSPLFQPAAEISRRPLWRRDSKVEGALLLYWEQGQGDTLQFIRFAQDFLEIGISVILEVQESLVRLVAQSFPGVTVIGENTSLPDFTSRLPIPSLPWFFGGGAEIFARSAYLRAQPDAWLVEQVQRPAIGLVWAGNPKHVNDGQRSIPQEDFLMLTALSGVSFYSLQVGATDKQRRALARTGVTDLTPGLSDFADTAAAIQALDLVITVDTSVAHLAGALGKTVWILLPFVPDWRWMLNRSDSPWYPSARLFRQPKRGDWGSVLKEVKQALVAFRDQAEANSAA